VRNCFLRRSETFWRGPVGYNSKSSFNPPMFRSFS